MACDTGTNIFSVNVGRVVAVTSEAVPVAFTVDDDEQTFNNLKAIVTSIGLNAQSGYQFTHSMREFIYIYVFTERVGEIVINGLAFPASCEELGPQDGAQKQCSDFGDSVDFGDTGLEQVLNWYECNRITTRASPINISFGPTTNYTAFLVGMKADIPNAETNIMQFAMRFNFIPNTVDNSDTCFDADLFAIPSGDDLENDCLGEPCTADDSRLQLPNRRIYK